MSTAADYLQKNYLYEEITLIDESISSWLQKINSKNLINKLDSVVKKKDSKMIESFLNVMPKTDFKTLYTIASKVNENFSAAFSAMKKESGSRFPTLKGIKLDVFSLIFGLTIVTKSDLKRAAKDTIDNVITQFKKVGVKKFGAEAMAGTTLVILSGILVSVALITLHTIPLIFSLIVIGLALLVFMV